VEHQSQPRKNLLTENNLLVRLGVGVDSIPIYLKINRSIPITLPYTLMNEKTLPNSIMEAHATLQEAVDK